MCTPPALSDALETLRRLEREAIDAGQLDRAAQIELLVEDYEAEAFRLAQI